MSLQGSTRKDLQLQERCQSVHLRRNSLFYLITEEGGQETTSRNVSGATKTHRSHAKKMFQHVWATISVQMIHVSSSRIWGAPWAENLQVRHQKRTPTVSPKRRRDYSVTKLLVAPGITTRNKKLLVAMHLLLVASCY